MSAISSWVERSDYEHEEMEQAAWFGIPWPEFNHGLVYTDTVKYATSASPQSLLDFYSLRYKESASKQGWLQRIRNGQVRGRSPFEWFLFGFSLSFSLDGVFK